MNSTHSTLSHKCAISLWVKAEVQQAVCMEGSYAKHCVSPREGISCSLGNKFTVLGGIRLNATLIYNATSSRNPHVLIHSTCTFLFKSLASTHKPLGEQQWFLEALLSHQMKTSPPVVMVKEGWAMFGPVPPTYRETDGRIKGSGEMKVRLEKMLEWGQGYRT